MGKVKVEVVEDRTYEGGYIFCRAILNEGCLSYGGSMYFICNEDREIIQWKVWMETDPEIVEGLKKLGYTFGS